MRFFSTTNIHQPLLPAELIQIRSWLKLTVTSLLIMIFRNFPIVKKCDSHKSLKGQHLQKRIYELRHRALDMLIEEQLILDHFNSNDAYQVPSSLLEERIEKSIARRFGSNRDKFYDMLNQKNMTVEEYRKEVERGIILELMRMEFVRRKNCRHTS